MTIVAYSISSGMAAIAGLLLIGRLNVATPTAALGWELTAIASVVVGRSQPVWRSGHHSRSLHRFAPVCDLGNGANVLGVDPFSEMVIAGLLIAVVVYLDNVHKRRQAGV